MSPILLVVLVLGGLFIYSTMGPKVAVSSTPQTPKAPVPNQSSGGAPDIVASVAAGVGALFGGILHAFDKKDQSTVTTI